MQIPLEFYEHLRNKIKTSDIIKQKISLTKKSGEYIGLCPFHTEKTPSFTVNDVKRFYHCFGCGMHGDVIKFIASINGFSYKDAAVKLANDYSIPIPQISPAQVKLYEESDEIYSILQQALNFFKSHLTQQVVSYLKTRGLTDNIIKEFEIGFAPSGNKLIKFFENIAIPIAKLENAGLVSKKQEDRIYEVFHNRIIFPIKNIYNKVIGFGARAFGEAMPKYLNSPETLVFKKSEILYGENKAISASYKKNYIILVEGYLDVISLHNAGFIEAVASLGTAVTPAHVQKLWKYADEIIICLDGDNAGLKASQKVINLALPLIDNQKHISFINLPAGDDPHDIIVKQSAKIFDSLLSKRVSLSSMIWQLEYQKINSSTPENQAKLQNNLEDYCNQIANKTLSYSYRRFFKDQIWQYVIRNNKKKPFKQIAINNNTGLITNPHSEIELLERRLCTLLIKFPSILKNEEIKNFFSQTNFQTLELTDFKWWCIEQFDNISNLTIENIARDIESSGFYAIYNLLLKSNDQFLDTSACHEIDYNLLFEILQKKYYLVLLREECALVIQNTKACSFEKFNKYRIEILKISTELRELEESFATNMRSI